jgi:enoyl-CoA hydratase
MDMILTGRAVSAEEAHAMGLVNRLAPQHGALDAALNLAREIAAHPQTCLRNDRLSALEQWSLGLNEATRNEFAHGLATLESGETVLGASAFMHGAGRHGKTR